MQNLYHSVFVEGMKTNFAWTKGGACEKIGLMEMNDTIAALATAPGTGAIAVLRVSGPAAQAVLHACSGRRLKPRRATLLRLHNAHGAVVDEVVATLFAAPASYTGEDVVEISCHGGMLVTRRVLELLLANGARPAEAGEFSRRAFENGRLDLTQAEAVMDVISAGSDLALRAAQNQLQGAIGARVAAAADILVDLAAHIEAYIDFPDEDIAPDTVADMLAKLDAVAAEVDSLLGTADCGRLLREGVRTAIVGAPNVGKSSLLNLLLGYDRAIVSEVAGTTRDTIEESVNLGGLSLRLIDTAGLRESGDAIELAGMERSRREGSTADLVLEVADSTRPPLSLGLEVPPGAHHLFLLNKCDLPEHPAWVERKDALRLSCRTGAGKDELSRRITELFLQQNAETDTLAAINTRHRYALQLAKEHLSAVRSGLQENLSPEFIDVDLRDALDALGSITGRIDTDAILDRVFSTFCLGK